MEVTEEGRIQSKQQWKGHVDHQVATLTLVCILLSVTYRTTIVLYLRRLETSDGVTLLCPVVK